ncbi:MAG: hypothetical protein FD167_411 [bacterium]|nr:MAG: hypothetical protein FD167_411 [bacterium]
MITPLSTPTPNQRFFVRIDGDGFDSNTAQVVVIGPGCPNFGNCVITNGALKEFNGTVTTTKISSVPLTISSGTYDIYVRNGDNGTPSAPKPFTVNAPANNNIGNVQVTFSPSSVSRSSDGNYHYTVTIKETNGVGVNLTSMTIGGQSYNQQIAPFFSSTRLSPYESRSVSITTTCPNCSQFDLEWKFGGNDDNQHNNLFWSNSIRLQ